MGTPPTTPIPNEESPLVPGPTAPASYVQAGTFVNNASTVVNLDTPNPIQPGPGWPGNYKQPS